MSDKHSLELHSTSHRSVFRPRSPEGWWNGRGGEKWIEYRGLKFPRAKGLIMQKAAEDSTGSGDTQRRIMAGARDCA